MFSEAWSESMDGGTLASLRWRLATIRLLRDRPCTQPHAFPQTADRHYVPWSTSASPLWPWWLWPELPRTREEADTQRLGQRLSRAWKFTEVETMTGNKDGNCWKTMWSWACLTWSLLITVLVIVISLIITLRDFNTCAAGQRKKSNTDAILSDNNGDS